MTNPSIIFRIVWCRRLRRQAPTQSEEEGWRAEEQGLRDALRTRDHSNHYRSRLPSVFERYLLGFRDAQALMRLASMEWHSTQVSDIAHVSSPRLLSEEIKGDAHISTLVIDEEKPAHPVLRCLLEYDDQQVLEASHSRRGLELHREQSADLLVTDLAMPKMYGMDFISDS
jgi:Response regulator receiver domain